jgi:hypothetical protein
MPPLGAVEMMGKRDRGGGVDPQAQAARKSTAISRISFLTVISKPGLLYPLDERSEQ